MSWEDRIREAAYVSPDGKRLTFDFQSVTRETEKRTAAFNFPSVNGSYVQDNGYGSGKYALRCYFNGQNCDIEATEFETALLLPGIGTLEHPLYGTFDVVPFGSISRRDDLVNEANQSIVDVTFWTTVGAVYPSAATNPVNEITAALDSFTGATAEQFQATADLESVTSQAQASAAVTGILGILGSSLADASSQVATQSRQVEHARQRLSRGLDVLIGQPLELVGAIMDLMLATSNATSPIQDQLSWYEDVAVTLITSKYGRVESAYTNLPRKALTIRNQFLLADLFAMGSVAASVKAATGAKYATADEALATAQALMAQLDRVVAWRDGAYSSLYIVDTGEAYASLLKATTTAAGYLITRSFSLARTRSIVLDRARSIIELAAELYGEVDPKLDTLISQNSLTGSEIMELERGRIILYYV